LRVWLGGLVAAAAALFVWLILRPVPVDVELGTTDRGDVPVHVRDRGVAQVRNVFEVAAPVGGRLRRVEVEVGDAVQADRTIIARLQPVDPGFLDARAREAARAHLAEAEARLVVAEALVRRAVAESRAADIEYRRVEALARDGWVAAAARDRVTAARDEARASVAAARAEARAAGEARAEARAMLAGPLDTSRQGEILIRAPVSGRILALHHQSETVVLPGEVLVSLGDPGGDLEIVGELLSTDAVKVRAGQPAFVEQWGGPVALEGRVRGVEPFGFLKVSALGIEEQRVNVWVDLMAPRAAWAALGHGYRVEVRIETDRAVNVVRVPVTALVRVGGEWAVFAAENGRARLHRLVLGRMNATHAEVRDGINAGARVILFPAEAVVDGGRIRPAGAPQGLMPTAVRQAAGSGSADRG
jgi:HlyD family secretion protein